MRRCVCTSAVIVFVLSFSFVGTRRSPARPAKAEPSKLLDILWVWGIPQGIGAYDIGKSKMVSTTDPAQFAQADARSKAMILGVPNVLMAGDGLPNDLEKAEELSRGIADLKRIGWELTPDNGEGPPFIYTGKVRVLKTLKVLYPQIEAVSIDDMLTSQRGKGLHPEHIASLRRQLHSTLPGLNMWGIVYTMNLNDPLLPRYLKFLDIVNLWTWQADDLRNLDTNFAGAERLAQGKPIVLGLYMYDYGMKRRMPRELMRLQCDKALELAKQGRVQGLIFLGVSNDPEIIRWTRDWINKVGGEPIRASTRVAR
jgi:hypothetical protein